MELGNLIKKQRADLGLTQEEVAKKLSVTRQTLSNWENEKSYPDLEQLLKLSDIYHFSIDSLLSGDPKLRKSLDSNKVERILEPLDYLPYITVVAMTALSFIATKETSFITFVVATALLIVTLIVALVRHRMDRYIGYSKLTLKFIAKVFAILVPIFLIIDGIAFFTIGHRNIHNALIITVGINLILLIGFLAFMKFGFHVLDVSNKAEENGMTLDEWLEEEEKAKKYGMTMDEWLKEREANKSTTNESEEDNDDEDSK